MAKEAAIALLAELCAAFAANTDRLRASLAVELVRPSSLEKGRRFQFELDPFDFGISSCATEESILPGSWLDNALPADWFDRAEAVEGGWNEMISEELCPWFAEIWQAVGGPAVFSPAYLFIHGYDQKQFDLDRRLWITAAEAFGD